VTRVVLDRADLEALASAATAYCVLQRASIAHAGPPADLAATVDGVPTMITTAQQLAELAALEATVIRIRRLLGWRR